MCQDGNPTHSHKQKGAIKTHRYGSINRTNCAKSVVYELGGALAQSGSTTFPAGPRVSSSHVPPLLTTVVGLPGRICSAPPSPRTRTSSSPDLRSQTRASPSTIATKLSPMTDGSTRSLGRSIVICSTIEPSSSTESSEPRSDSITSIWGLDPDPITRESLAPEPSGRDLSATRESDSL